MRWRSGIGDLGARMTFEVFDMLKGKEGAVEVARTWDPKADPGVVFYGPTGTGKTHLACAIIHRLIDEGIFCVFLPTVRIPRNDSEAIEKLTDPSEVPVLILDDVGAEKLTERALECLYEIVDGRIWNRAPLVVTTNFKKEELRRRINLAGDGHGDRLVGRLEKTCRWVPVGGKDMRRGAK